IVDSVYGMQPMILHAYPHLTLICNGELYNFKRLGEEMQFNYETKCDVEVIIQMFARTGSIEETVRNLDGVFAFALIDTKNRKLYIARDPYGVRPLYRMETDCGILGISSEGKGLIIAREFNGESFEWDERLRRKMKNYAWLYSRYPTADGRI
ncbi:unnamed protein product, partial [Nesidiocoris tenuis]